ncbi:MAG: hypothetical protein RIQ81_170 [Pseudomonadota bacterium]|jgi:hypothetical protein
MLRLAIAPTHEQIVALLSERARRYIAFRRGGMASMDAITQVVKGSYTPSRANIVARILIRFETIRRETGAPLPTEGHVFMAMMGCSQLADREDLPWTHEQFLDALSAVCAEHKGFLLRRVERDTGSWREFLNNAIYDFRLRW